MSSLLATCWAPRNPYKEGFRKHRVTCLKLSGWLDILTPAKENSCFYPSGVLDMPEDIGLSGMCMDAVCHSISASLQVVKHEIVELFQRLANGTCKNPVKAGPGVA